MKLLMWKGLNTPSYTPAPCLTPSPTPSPISNAPVTTTPIVTQFLTFKCIGATRDEKQQKALEIAFVSTAKGDTVRVSIEAEPTNVYDSEAIALLRTRGRG